MRVLFVNHSASLTGAPISCLLLMTGLNAEDVSVFASRERGLLTARLDALGIRNVIVPEKGFLGYGFILDFMRIIRDERIDIVHLNTLTPFCKYAGIAAVLTGRPVVWAVREDPLISRSRKLRFWLKRLSAKIVFVDADTKKKLLPDDPRAVVISNGVDLDLFKPSRGRYLQERFGIPEGTRTVGFVGSITKRKGIHLLVNAFSDIRDKGGKIKLVIIGGPADEGNPYYAELAAQVRGLGLAEDVIFTGVLTEMTEVMSSLDVVVLPSGDERCSRTLLEAISCGRPVVATKVGGNPEIVPEGVAGLLVPPEDEKALAAAIVRLLADDGLREEMGRNGRRHAEEHFSLEVTRQLMRELYQGLVRKT